MSKIWYACITAYSSISFAATPDVAINGNFRFDQVYFSEKNAPAAPANKFYNGAIAPAATLMITTTFSKSLSFYSDFDLLSPVPVLGIAYLQLKNNQNSLMLGQVPSPFCLEYANSSKWLPFLHRSLAVNAFAPCTGPGANFRWWHKNLVVNMAATQLGYGSTQKNAPADDRWGGSIRAVAKPLTSNRHLVHIGANASYQAQKDALEFKTSEIKGRNIPTLLSTTVGGTAMQADDYLVFGGEAAGRFGPLQVEGDYLTTTVRRVGGADTLKFSGWSAQGNYFLTGEQRSYNEETASFAGPDKIRNERWGAWQLALRTSQVSLNDHDIKGGRQIDNSVALNWYVDQYIKATANYIQAHIWPQADAPNRAVHMLGLRLQVSW